MVRLFLVAVSCLSFAGIAHADAPPLDEAETAKLFEAGNFDALEKIKDSALSTKEITTEGYWQLERFYWILNEQCDALAQKSENRIPKTNERLV